MAEDTELITLLGEKTLHLRAEPSLVAYCPSMDLVAIATSDQQVIVYRLNGQRVYAVVQKQKSLKVQRLYWKPNGQLLAIAYDDGITRLYGAESSKTVHQIITGNGDVTCLGWVSNVTNGGSTKAALDRLSDAMGSAVESSKPHSLDLPRDLTLIDVESSMVKLSVLPAGGTSEDVFSSRASLDALFRPFDPKDNDFVDVMIVGTRDSKVHLSIYDSFEVGTFSLPSKGPDMGHLVLHTSYPQFSTHGVLMKPTSESSSMLTFLPMDLRFIGTSDGHLSLLAAKSTQLQNLLRYVNQVQSLMKLEYKSTQDLPQRFLGNVNESLAEKYKYDVVHAMYHQVATGHTYPVMKEWLVDELAERGHKRWEKAVIGGYEGLRKLTHEHILPALERCSVILSRLYGIAKFQSNDELGLSLSQIKKVMDTVSCLSMCSSRILAYTIEELDYFQAFSAWMRHEIDRLASDSSSPSEDMLEKEAAIEHGKVLHFIQTAMMNSKLSAFFNDGQSDDSEVEIEDDGISLFERLDVQLQRHSEGQSYVERLCNVSGLCQRMDIQAKALFEHMAESHKRNVFFGEEIPLKMIGDSDCFKMRMCAEGNECVIYIATSSTSTDENDASIRIYRLVYTIKNSLSTLKSREEIVVVLGAYTIDDLEFEDSTNLLILMSSQASTLLTAIPYTPKTMKYGIKTASTQSLSTAEIDTHTLHVFPANGSFLPGKMLVSERNLAVKSRDDDGRICLLSKDHLVYKIYSLREREGTSIGLERESEEDITMSQ